MSSPGRAGRGAVRSRRSAIDVAVIGTADPASRAVLRALVQHPLTDKGLAAFLADWKKAGQRIV